MTNDEAKGNVVHYRPWIGEHTRPACGSLRLATTNFDLWEVRERGDAFSSARDGRAAQKIAPLLYGAMRSVSVSV